ncbi:MAG: hypothetical protein VZR53_08120 [Prevotella sp.]|nr:hypothetical protein [Prevotella sp.]
MGLNKDYISLICKTDNPTLGEVLLVYQISGIYSETVNGVIMNTDGEDTSNSTLVIVPYKAKCNETYIKPKAWEKLALSAKEQFYTFREGDVILINQTPVGCKSLEEIKQKYDDCYAIQTIKDFDKIMKHFELICR